MKHWWQARQAAFAEQATQKVYLSYPKGVKPPIFFRFVVGNLSKDIHELIAQDVNEDPSMMEPDIGLDHWPPEGPDPEIADMDTRQGAQVATDRTVVDSSASDPFWAVATLP